MFGGIAVTIVKLATWPMVRIGSSTVLTMPEPATVTDEVSLRE